MQPNLHICVDSYCDSFHADPLALKYLGASRPASTLAMLTATRSARRVRVRVGADRADYGCSDADLCVRLRERALDARLPQHVVLSDDHVRRYIRRCAGLLRVAHLPTFALPRTRRRDVRIHMCGACAVSGALCGGMRLG